jgi:hypothetical protein
MISFDIVQWLVGEEADDAYRAETGDPSGVPNDYFILNESDQVRTARVSDDAEIWLSGLRGNSDNVGNPFLASFPELVDASEEPLYQPFWLTFDEGEIVGVCEQYTP